MCNCKKTKQVQTQVITGTPEPIPTPEVITEIKDIQDGRTNGETE